MLNGDENTAFEKFCERILKKFVCDMKLDISYHKGKYLPLKFLGAREMEEPSYTPWEEFKKIRSQEDPEKVFRSVYLDVLEERIAKEYSAC